MLTGPDQRFCVVTPNFNMADFLESTIRSVLVNLGPQDEYYVVDGGSTDGSIGIIKRYSDRISGWLSEPDRGYADAIRKGFAMSDAPLMCWINSGDLLLDGSLTLRRELMQGGCDLIYGDDYYIDENGIVLQHSNGNAGHLASMMLYGGWTPLQDACTWRRALYEACGGLNPDISYAADFDLFLRMSLHGSACYAPATLSAFRRHGEQKSISGAAQYAQERDALRAGLAAPGLRSLALRAWYAGVARMRARIRPMNRRNSPVVGRDVRTLKASRHA